MSTKAPAVGDVLGTMTVEGRVYEVYVDSRIAQNLTSRDKLTDGTYVIRVFIGLRGVRLTGVKEGKIVRRLYRDINKPVLVEEWRYIGKADT